MTIKYIGTKWYNNHEYRIYLITKNNNHIMRVFISGDKMVFDSMYLIDLNDMEWIIKECKSRTFVEIVSQFELDTNDIQKLERKSLR